MQVSADQAHTYALDPGPSLVQADFWPPLLANSVMVSFLSGFFGRLLSLPSESYFPPKMQAAASFIKNGKKVQVTITNSLYIQLTGYQIVAIGRNYAQHVKELNNPMPKEPFFFLKPTTSYVQSGGKVEIPRGIIAHHEGTLS